MPRPKKQGKAQKAEGVDPESADPAILEAAIEPVPFPAFDLPIAPPYPPMEAKSASEIPEGSWLYEPKWDGFRGLTFRDRREIAIQSKAGQSLGRYFPELVALWDAAPERDFVVDGEIVIIRSGHLDFEALLQRIHPAPSRIERLAKETPATYLIFDLLVDRGRSLTELPLKERRLALDEFFRRQEQAFGRSVRLSPVSSDVEVARSWMRELAGSGFDGIVAKRADKPYLSGERGMVKVKRIRSADCVVGGFRYASKGGGIGSLLLGLYDDAGLLHHIGFTSGFNAELRAGLKEIVEPLIQSPGFTGKAPGGPSRWSTERTGEWQPLSPRLVCEVHWDHFSGGRFRHGTKFMRWRPDKEPRQCTMEQVALRPTAVGDTLL